MTILDDGHFEERKDQQRKKQIQLLLWVFAIMNILGGIIYFLSLINDHSESELIAFSYYLIPFLVFNLTLPSKSLSKIFIAVIASVGILWLFYELFWAAL